MSSLVIPPLLAGPGAGVLPAVRERAPGRLAGLDAVEWRDGRAGDGRAGRGGGGGAPERKRGGDVVSGLLRPRVLPDGQDGLPRGASRGLPLQWDGVLLHEGPRGLRKPSCCVEAWRRATVKSF